MSTTQLEPADPAVNYDEIFRFTIPSRSRAHETHMVDLDCYNLNGMCSCENFQFKFGELLAKGYTPETALAEGLVTLKRKGKPDKHPDDALRCDHIVDAWRRFSIVAARAIHNEKIRTTPKEDPPPF
jgi:hypothetical protein